MSEFGEFASGARPVLETLDWLQTSVLPSIQEGLNEAKVRARLGLYNGDVVPTNERNLTDTRNRVSIVYEYLLADRVTAALQEQGTDKLCAYVVANRFPDLEIRNGDGTPGLRLEVKCLQSTAEEKSANFSTLIKDVHPGRDFLIVFLWEWSWDVGEFRWDRAPLISHIFAFNAYALAKLRDWYWLNRPPKGLGAAYQGFDLRNGITANKSIYKEEEGNYGKLLRVWESSFDPKPEMSEILTRTERDYVIFRDIALQSGFDNLSRTILSSLDDREELEVLAPEGDPIGYKRGPHWFVLNSRVSNERLISAMTDARAGDVIVFKDNYQWSHCRLTSCKLETITDKKKPKKPKELGDYLRTEYLRNLGEG